MAAASREGISPCALLADLQIGLQELGEHESLHSYGTSTSPAAHCNCMECLKTSEEIWVSPTLKTSPILIKFCKK